MSSSKLLRRIAIKTPCAASWEEMTGNDQVRFCEHCSLHVQDLSQMTRVKAEKLVLKSKGRLCLRIRRNPLGEIVTRPAVQKLYAISRRTSRLAAGAFTAVLSMSAAAYAQSGNAGAGNDAPPVAVPTVAIPEPNPPVTVPVEGGAMGGAMVMVVNYQQPLVKAAYDNDLAALKEALRNGADPNQAEEDGTTALELAVGHGDLKMVRRLLRAGANVNPANENGGNVLLALDDDSDARLISLLINAGASVNQANEDGETPLTHAAEFDDGELIQALIDAGAYVNAQNSVGNSALMIAAMEGNAESVKTLLAAGAIFGLRDADKLDALQLAQANNNEDVCDLLRAAGAVDSVAPPAQDPIGNSSDPAPATTPGPYEKRED